MSNFVIVNRAAVAKERGGMTAYAGLSEDFTHILRI
jgi:hypothetical protein